MRCSTRRTSHGRLSVIIRMGAKNVREHLPKLVQAVTDAGIIVTWVCDPVHGNTETVSGYKTRRYDTIRAEVEAFFDVHAQMGTVPGGVHLEMTGDNVTECIGGALPACLLCCVLGAQYVSNYNTVVMQLRTMHSSSSLCTQRIGCIEMVQLMCVRAHRWFVGE